MNQYLLHRERPRFIRVFLVCLAGSVLAYLTTTLISSPSDLVSAESFATVMVGAPAVAAVIALLVCTMCYWFLPAGAKDENGI